MEIAANPKDYRMKQSWRQASMQILNSSVAKPWKLEQNILFWTSKRKKKQARKNGSPIQDSSRSCLHSDFSLSIFW